jgi:hypothetical protein
MVEKLQIYTNKITFVIDKNTPLKHKTEKKSNNKKSENTRLWCHKTLEYDFSNHILKKTANQKLNNIYHGFSLGVVNYKKGALDSQPQVIKFTSCLPMVSGSLRILWLPPPLKLVAMI